MVNAKLYSPPLQDTEGGMCRFKSVLTSKCGEICWVCMHFQGLVVYI